MTQSRQLAAIMFTDIVGYTALMSANERKAFELLRKNREVQKPLIKQFNGTWIKEIGDGVLASFHTISDAVLCAGSIHHACTKVDGLQLRIGIHLGEVVFENNDVFGDGVNIASRLQALAPIGGTLISEAVYKNVMNKSEFTTEYIREENLKNINEPVKIYEVKLNEPDGLVHQSLLKSGERKNIKLPKRKKTIFGIGVLLILIALVLFYFLVYQKKVISSDKNMGEKSIAVLPFLNISGDPQQDYFSDGLSEELINMFTRLPGLKVIGRTSSFVFKGKNEDLREIGKKLKVEYLLEGSVRKSGNVIRITAQLIKANDGTHLWSASYDREVNDIFKVQSEIARMIAQKLEIIVTPETDTKISQTPTNNIEAYEQFQKGMYFLYKKYYNTGQIEDFEKSKIFFERAIQLDSGYAEAYAGLAEAYDELYNQNPRKFPGVFHTLKENMARKALALNPNSSFVNTAMAWSWAHRPDPNSDSSFFYLHKAYLLDPEDPLSNQNLGSVLITDHELHSLAVPLLLTSVKGDPLDGNNYILLANAYSGIGRDSAALDALRNCLEITNEELNYEPMLLILLCYYGDFEAAEKRLNAREGQFPFQKALFYAIKGELDKISPEYRYDPFILLITNRHKVSKDVIKSIESYVEQGKNNYNFLANSYFFDVYREEPDFKRILAKSKKIYDAKLLKYENYLNSN